LPPPVPVMVTVLVPSCAPLDATARVRVEDPEPGAVMDVGLKVAVTLLGTPLAESATAELNAPTIVVLIVEVPEAPRTTTSDVGFALSEKSGGTTTARLTVVVCVIPPPVPVMVTTLLLSGAPAMAVNVTTDEPAPGARTGFTLKAAVTPDGNPLADSVCAALKAPTVVLVIVEVACDPCATFTDVGFADREKSGGGWTTSVTEATLCMSALMPLIRTGYVPGGVAPVVFTVMFEVPLPVSVGGEKEAVAPAGKPMALSATWAAA
jgi:hypothetical protein